MRNLLRKIHFGQLSRKLSLNRPIIRLKFAQNLPQTGFPSRRLSFSDSLLVSIMLFSPMLIAQPTIQATDSEGNILYFIQPVKRIISLAPHTTELLFAAGATHQIIGTVNHSDFPEAAKKIPRIGGYNKFDLETILSLKPDLIVAWSGGNSHDQIQKLKQLGIKIFISEPKNFTDIAENIIQMGRFLGTNKTANHAAQEFLTELTLLKKQFPKEKTVSVFYQVWNEPLMTISDAHLIGKVIQFCSGKNIFGNLNVISPRINIEAVLEKNPDTIIAGMTKDRKDWLLEWEKWGNINAVKYKQVYAINADLLVRQTPRILQGTRKMCSLLNLTRKNKNQSH